MKFPIGQLTATPAALQYLEDHGVLPSTLVKRHVNGDWGDLGRDDKKANDDALKFGDRIFSSYKVGKGSIWVITEADRSYTTVLQPSDY